MIMLDTKSIPSIKEYCPDTTPFFDIEKIQSIQENERKKLSAEIHDSVVQWLVGAFYQTRICSSLIAQSKPADLEAELAKIGTVLKNSLTELRRIMADLHPLPLEEGGFVNALNQTTEALKSNGVRCKIEIDKALPKLNRAMERAIYRIVQEAMTNCRKHSQATDVCLNVKYLNNTISVEVNDNGCGFNPEEVRSRNSKMHIEHLGLIGMKERAELLGGHLSVNSQPGGGTSIRVIFPVSS